MSDEILDMTEWERRTTTDEPRLSELVNLYEELGFDVLLRPISKEELGESCSECLLADSNRYRTIYTRQADKERHTIREGPSEQLKPETGPRTEDGDEKRHS